MAWKGVTAMIMRNGGTTISTTISVPRENNKEN